MRVVEIFKSIDGEGIRAGIPVTFIRLEGCNLRCSYCDTKYSYENASYKDMTVNEIFSAIYKLGCRRVTLTGGEPLIHEDVADLIKTISENGFEVNVETNGSVDISPFIPESNFLSKKVFFTVDYKCPSSGMEDKMFLDNLKILRSQDVLKFVVGSKEDLDKCRDMITYVRAHIFISPVFGKIEAKDIVEYMIEHGMLNCRVQLQMHKYIFDPDARGV